jgi:hypothetical protein
VFERGGNFVENVVSPGNNARQQTLVRLSCIDDDS